MKLWLDAQLSPALVPWMRENFDLDDVVAIQSDSQLITAKDIEIFDAARSAGAVVMTKDRDFVDLVERLGPPPAVIWITAGNTSNRAMRRILSASLESALEMIKSGEELVEISEGR